MVVEQAQKLVAAGQPEAAVELIRSAANAGDPEGLYAVAEWRLFGDHGDRDIAEAHRLLDQASAAGHVDAIRLKATLVGNGTGCVSDPRAAAAILRRIEEVDPYAKVQLVFSERMRSQEEAARLPSETLSEAPLVRVVRGLLTPEECNYLITLSEPRLEGSFVIDPRSGERIPHPVRTSSGTSFGPTQEDRVVHLINRRIAAVTSTDVNCGEPLHMLKYEPGQEYRPHHDALPGVANQRHSTVLVYLNEGYEGGETRFDLLSLQFRGRPGDALIFRNVDSAGAADPLARHAGLPVTGGIKWLATRWIRQEAYHPWA